MIIRSPVHLLIVAGVGTIIFLLPEVPLTLKKGLFIFWVIAYLWVSALIHLSATALLVPILGILLNVNGTRELLAYFAHPIIFLFLGGFSLATAFRKQGLDKLIAAKLLSLSKGHMLYSSLLLFTATALLSMWMSNTAVATMMLPLALGLLSAFNPDEQPRVYYFVLLGIAYSASVGGMGTLVGSPPNAIVAGALDLTFLDWIKIGLPSSLIILPILWLILYWLIRPASIQLKAQAVDTKLSQAQIVTLVIFFLTIIAWLFSHPLSKVFNVTKSFDSVIAMCALLLLILTRMISWKDLEKGTDWGVLILFGGGLCLGGILSDTGTTEFLAISFSSLFSNTAFVIFLIGLITFVVFLTELTSNTASTALLVPIFIGIAHTLNYSPHFFAIAIGLSASCAFMLPVATPPNALVFGTGFVPQRKMMQIGLVLNLVIIVLLTLLIHLFFR
ncbi:MAG TPA: Anion transporter [Gammaproteobacteria bacterium]|nr:Anion transporter [Gammaproteobacteria bacterium]